MLSAVHCRPAMRCASAAVVLALAFISACDAGASVGLAQLPLAGHARDSSRVAQRGRLGALARPTERLQRLRGGSDEELLTVQFKRSARTKDGEMLFVVGDCEALGFEKPEKAIPMTLGTDGVWTALVPNVPIGCNYQYFAARPTDIEESKRYMTGYKLMIRKGKGAAGGQLVADDTQQLIRFKIHKTAGEVKVVGSIPELGNWNVAKAPALQKKGNNNAWETVLSIPSEHIDDFQYKYVADGHHESGSDRWSDAYFVEPQPEEQGLVSNLEGVFEGLLIRFMIFHPTAPDEKMVITGAHPGLGNWKPVDNPCRMGLGNERTLLTGVKGRVWEATFPAPKEDFTDVSYRYIILNDKTNSAVWESEPNRKLQLIPGSDSTSKGYRQREWTQFDGNFVAKTLEFDEVPPNLIVGPYPQCAEDVQKMKDAGVTGVLNVQTDEDIRKRQVNMEVMQKLFDEAGIELCRVPILDFHGDDLAARVKYASKEVERMVHNRKHEGKEGKVYIHCTAGMGRAPAVACIWLVHKKGYKLEDAMAWVKKCRPVVAPNYEAMKQAIRNGLDC